ncbi:MAG TPA: hypothetical protein DDW94_01185 [Deltaproteobacteria bacterium]|nr:MAG: hypothetical protein A2Z79_06550 [Deltaproteobacteria bacterium GWA2_55_82]OGQ63323.1 MAG: hypothetical protein A3I81_01045 [Deltaproteobacteria bacterium RIFCSPLOWO2_02_FULL_55_12]OIJ73160.1 MAG: hypothetical protein A2V21_302110 [Deltaproteobacteria bacterium GWC2_55_46]HBG45585.1 hypothetical protein [Deltaproteobacteria bacterium]HCY10416.1 hypothetical protein [Deltaproteobacteria bacterium]
MRPRDHVIAGAAGAAALSPFIGWGESLVFMAASVLIDVDHYLDFLWHNRFTDFSLKGMFRYHAWLKERWLKPEFLNIEVFHTAEFLVPLLALSYRLGSGPLFALWLGFFFHAAVDAIYLSANRVPFIRAHSFAEYFIRRRRLEKRGLRPALLYLEAVKMTRED